MREEVRLLEEKIAGGYRVGYEEAVELLENNPTDVLCGFADSLRRRFSGNKIDTCSIMNARSGRCGEDCKWCSQSKFHATNIDVYPLVDTEAALSEAGRNASKGIRRFSLVTSGRTMSDGEVDKVCGIYKAIGGKTPVRLCASMGLLNREQLLRLKESGVERYHCNIETAPSFFPRLCTTHTVQEKLQTIRWAKEAGMDVCSGGIIGMGESERQRVEMAAVLQETGVVSIPVNVLNPIKGTKLENMQPLTEDEILRAVAVMRIVNPEADIRLAGGRSLIRNMEERLLNSGVSAFITGDMLTTSGFDVDSDREMFRRCGREMA